jgi:hypothetical protein
MTFQERDTKIVEALLRNPHEGVSGSIRDMMATGMGVRFDCQRTALPGIIQRRPRRDLVNA